MNNVSHFRAHKSLVGGAGFDDATALRDARLAYELLAEEAAIAVGVPLAVYQGWELDKMRGAPSLVYIQNCFVAYSRKFKRAGEEKNQIFGQYPLVVARELLCLSIEEMAQFYGASVASWKKYECNNRLLAAPLLRKIEADVARKFSAVCSAAAGDSEYA